MSKSKVRQHSAVIGGHKTSLSLEDEFWAHIKAMAADGEKTIGQVLGEARSRSTNLSSAARLHVLAHLEARINQLEGRR